MEDYYPPIGQDYLRQDGEYLFSRINHGNIAWTLWTQNEAPVLAGDIFVLSEEIGTNFVTGRSVDDGWLLFRASKEYARVMIAPRCDLNGSSTISSPYRMSSRGPIEVLEFLFKRVDEERRPVADPGFDQVVGSSDEFIRGIDFEVALFREHFHHQEPISSLAYG